MLEQPSQARLGKFNVLHVSSWADAWTLLLCQLNKSPISSPFPFLPIPHSERQLGRSIMVNLTYDQQCFFNSLSLSLSHTHTHKIYIFSYLALHEGYRTFTVTFGLWCVYSPPTSHEKSSISGFIYLRFVCVCVCYTIKPNNNNNNKIFIESWSIQWSIDFDRYSALFIENHRSSMQR